MLQLFLNIFDQINKKYLNLTAEKHTVTNQKPCVIHFFYYQDSAVKYMGLGVYLDDCVLCFT